MIHSTFPEQARDPRIIAGGALRPAEAPRHVRNRRHHLRFAAKGVASHLQSMSTSLPGLTVENISLGGVFVRSAAPLPVGTALALQLVRPGLKRAIQLTGRVIVVVTTADARARGSIAGMGIALDALDGDTSLRLHVLLDDLAAVAHVEHKPTPTPVPAAAVDLPPVLLPTPVEPLAATSVDPRVADLETEVAELRKELLRRNRSVAELARRLSRYESI